MTTILPRASDVILDTGLQYYVENHSDERLTTGDRKTDLLRYNRVTYRCDAGEKAIVPWEVIALYFGDPRSQVDKIVEAEDSQGKHLVPPRGNELLRLSVFYGVYEQGVDALAGTVPNVRITTLQGVEIVPPCFDPDNEYVYGYQKSMQKSGDVATLLANLEEGQAAMQEQIDVLRATKSSQEQHGDNDGDLPEDNPGMP
jgi:hypothetical protein